MARKIHRNDSRMSHNHFRGNVEPRMTHLYKLITHSLSQKCTDQNHSYSKNGK